MFRRALFFLILSASISLQAQELFIRAPRISNWDLRPGTLQDVDYWITPGATFIQIDADFTISAAGTHFSARDTLEAVLNLSLPDQSVVTDSWLWIENSIIKARIQDRWTAEDQFEEIVMRNLDPSILTRGFNQQYELKVFPMTVNWNRRVRISFVIPAALDDGQLSCILPNSILPTQQIADDEIEIHVRARESLDVLTIGDQVEISTQPGLITSRLLPKNAFGSQISFAAPDVQYLLQTYSLEDQKYFGLNLDDEQFLQKVSGVDKSLFIFDYSLANSIENLSEICDALVNGLRASFAEEEQLALFIDPDQVLEWTPATEDGIKEFAAKIRASDGFSDLPDALIMGIEYGHDLGADQIFLVSNSSPNWNADQISKALQWSRDANQENLPIHVISYQNTNWTTQSLNGLHFENNNYFLENLTAAHQGSLTVAPREEAISPEVFSSLRARGRQVHRAIDVDVPSGLAYAAEQHGGIYYGRYFGDEEFEVTIIDITNQKIDTVLKVKPNVKGVSHPIMQQWAGLQIEEMSNSLNGGYYYYDFDERIFDIISLSLDSRVLSSYTALLALEPALGGKVCEFCDVEEPGGQISRDFVFNTLGTEMTTSDDNSLTPVEEIEWTPWQLRISPNPAHDLVRIEISDELPEHNLEVKVFDLKGSNLLEISASNQYLLELDVGHFLAGMYFLHIRIDGEMFVRKLVVQRS